jgi:hypothetical protein
MRFSSIIVAALIGALPTLAAAASVPLEQRKVNTAPVVAKLKAYRGAHKLSDQQITAIDTAIELAESQDLSLEPGVKQKVIDAFGFEEAKALLTAKVESLERRAVDCECAAGSDWCWSGSYCRNYASAGVCARVHRWCGTLSLYDCNGLCIPA